MLDGSRPLFIPKHVSYKNALSVSLVTQSVITWGVHPADGGLVTDIDLDDSRAAQDLARNTPLLAAFALATSVQTLDGVDITERAKALSRFTLTEWAADIPQLAQGITVGTDRAVMAVDHEPSVIRPRGIYPRPHLDEESRPLYAGRPWKDALELRGRRPLGHRVLGISGQNPEGWGDNYSATGSALGMLLFELLQNTDIHARRTVYGNPLPRSVRLLHVRGFSQERSVLVRSDPADTTLMNFYANAPAVAGNERLRFLVISVLDSGPGLAATLLRRENYTAPTSPTHELEYFLRALRMTSSGSTREPMRGLGLRRVQTFLTALGGFARIRSGRFEVQRNFASAPYQGPESDDRKWWGGVGAPTAKEKLAGTAFTLLIPVPPSAAADVLWRAAADGG
ncbi:hypothetical protein EV279_1740 [Microbacterium sp. BK668]|nr:hypothetical protein EV279_1740 [Microbacterium sp. BK668]